MIFSHLYSSALDAELGTDDSTRLFTTARRKNAINEALLQWADQTACLMRESTFSCSNGIAEYNLLSTANLSPGNAGDFLRFGSQMPEYRLVSSGSTASTQFIAGDQLPRRDIDWLNQNDPGWRGSTGGTPSGFYVRPSGNGYWLGLTPPPRIGSSEAGSVRLPYIAKPAVMTSDTEVPFTQNHGVGSGVVYTRPDLEPYHQGLVHYAAYLLEKLRVNLEGAQIQLQLFQQYVARYVRASEPVGPRTIRTARNYWQEVRARRGSGREDSTPWPWRQ